MLEGAAATSDGSNPPPPAPAASALPAQLCALVLDAAARGPGRAVPRIARLLALAGGGGGRAEFDPPAPPSLTARSTVSELALPLASARLADAWDALSPEGLDAVVAGRERLDKLFADSPLPDQDRRLVEDTVCLLAYLRAFSDTSGADPAALSETLNITDDGAWCTVFAKRNLRLARPAARLSSPAASPADAFPISAQLITLLNDALEDFRLRHAYQKYSRAYRRRGLIRKKFAGDEAIAGAFVQDIVVAYRSMVSFSGESDYCVFRNLEYINEFVFQLPLTWFTLDALRVVVDLGQRNHQDAAITDNALRFVAAFVFALPADKAAQHADSLAKSREYVAVTTRELRATRVPFSHKTALSVALLHLCDGGSLPSDIAAKSMAVFSETTIEDLPLLKTALTKFASSLTALPPLYDFLNTLAVVLSTRVDGVQHEHVALLVESIAGAQVAAAVRKDALEIFSRTWREMPDAFLSVWTAAVVGMQAKPSRAADALFAVVVKEASSRVHPSLLTRLINVLVPEPAAFVELLKTFSESQIHELFLSMIDAILEGIRIPDPSVFEAIEGKTYDDAFDVPQFQAAVRRATRAYQTAMMAAVMQLAFLFRQHKKKRGGEWRAYLEEKVFKFILFETDLFRRSRIYAHHENADEIKIYHQLTKTHYALFVSTILAVVRTTDLFASAPVAMLSLLREVFVFTFATKASSWHGLFYKAFDAAKDAAFLCRVLDDFRPSDEFDGGSFIVFYMLLVHQSLPYLSRESMEDVDLLMIMSFLTTRKRDAIGTELFSMAHEVMLRVVEMGSQNIVRDNWRRALRDDVFEWYIDLEFPHSMSKDVAREIFGRILNALGRYVDYDIIENRFERPAQKKEVARPLARRIVDALTFSDARDPDSVYTDDRAYIEEDNRLAWLLVSRVVDKLDAAAAAATSQEHAIDVALAPSEQTIGALLRSPKLRQHVVHIECLDLLFSFLANIPLAQTERLMRVVEDSVRAYGRVPRAQWAQWSAAVQRIADHARKEAVFVWYHALRRTLELTEAAGEKTPRVFDAQVGERVKAKL